MPRDSDKHNDSPRGRRDRGGPKGSFKGRSGKPRGPEKKFAKRGFAGKGDRDERPSRGDRNSRPFRRREEGDAPRRDFGDRPRFKRDDRGREDRGERSFKPRGDRPFKPRGDHPKFASDERAPRGERSERRFEDRKFSRGGSDRPRKDFGRDRDFEGKDRKRDFGDRKRDFEGGDRKRSFGDRPRDRDDRPRKNFGKSFGKDFGGRDRGEEKPWRQRDDRREGGRGDDRPRFSRRRDEGSEDRPRFGRSREGRSQGRSDWHEHPRSAGRFRDRPRRDNEDDSKIFSKRPAFGGRGVYRERDRDFEGRPHRDEAPKPKKAGERIAKVLARAGLASRRDAEEMVTQGRVTVNGRVINSPALDVTQNDVVAVDGKPLPPRERTRLFLYHKPRGLMTTHDDPEGRPTVFDNLPEGLPRLISVGRLDFNTEGLLLLTNDGGLARTLELPDTGWLRRYRVRAHGDVTQAQLDELKNGIEVEGVKYGPIEATLERDQGANVWLVFAIREGKNREVRNVCAHLGLEVNRLIRVSYGPFQLGEIPEGQVDEIKSRVLREQLGDKVIERSGAQFDVPSKSAPRDDDAPREKKPMKRAVINDRKGRRVLVQRTGSEEARERNEWEAGGYGPPRRPKRGYHGKRDLKPRED
ncbi:pseudouridine synthase [Bradyrhizobium sp. CB1650]|uniref:pseudouridine synthase n=1 Tax=Bradyrhizobium sp. CB1650 TaxID=3039153 RepID=UPI002435211D|nr:pseudouridine synthase [Bradyrhizobium sp. CB1650]WGD53879.1 pseudouridine synthase [Bradyrhizobium sp. CB1650]